MDNRIVGIASQLYNVSGAFVLKPDYGKTVIRGGKKRLMRNKTLDGGVVFTDGGLSAGDMTFEIQIASTVELWASLWALFSATSWVTITTEQSCYLAKIGSMVESGGNIVLSVMIKEDLIT